VRWLFLLMLGGCQWLFPLTPDRVEPIAQGRRTVTITPPTGTPLPNFPVGILIDDGSLAGIDASNMRFIDEGGTELSSELLLDEDGLLEAWVQIPLLEAPITIDLEWGGATVHETDPRTVWDPAFVGVWHLSEASGPARDSAHDPLGPHDLLDIGGSEALAVEGMLGAARRLDGNDALCAIDASGFQFGVEPFSYSVWVNTETTNTDFDSPLTKGGGNDGNPGFNFELGEGGWAANVCCDASAIADHFLADTATMDNRWVHLMAVVDTALAPPRLSLFVDTALADDSPLQNAAAPAAWAGVDGTQPLCIGGTSMPNETFFHGDVDEVRIYRGPMPLQWFVTETFNLNNREQFIELGEPAAL
jgi:hypothetical protein